MVHKDHLRERAVDAVHGVVEHGEVLTVHHHLDGREPEDALEHIHVVLGAGMTLIVTYPLPSSGLTVVVPR